MLHLGECITATCENFHDIHCKDIKPFVKNTIMSGEKPPAAWCEWGNTRVHQCRNQVSGGRLGGPAGSLSTAASLARPSRESCLPEPALTISFPFAVAVKGLPLPHSLASRLFSPSRSPVDLLGTVHIHFVPFPYLLKPSAILYLQDINMMLSPWLSYYIFLAAFPTVSRRFPTLEKLQFCSYYL